MKHRPKGVAALIAILFAAACAPAAPPAAPAPTTPAIEEPAAEATAFLPAVDTRPDRWWLLDPELDGVAGAGVDRAYAELLAGREPAREVVVAIIDSGVDTAHVELRPILWRNPGEVAGTGRDDDGNGYIDDVHGWNFIGGPDGRNVDVDTYEVTRLHAACEAGAGAGASSAAERCAEIAEAYVEKVAETREMLARVREIGEVTHVVWRILRDELGVEPTVDAVRSLQRADRMLMQARQVFLELDEYGIDPDMVDRELERLEQLLEYGLDPAFDPRHIVGDDYADLDERFYGNADVTGPDAAHGTGVAGIVGTMLAPSVRIMAIRAVPNGDERDKDVANAIRYAVDNGAHIVNMSFGKAFSPGKAAVDAAVRYADERGVLLVNAAGNDGKDLGIEPSFPSRFFLDGDTARHWIQVGASSWRGGEELAAGFSNYGRDIVHVFAPGVDILSAAPGDAHETASGTSFAAPVVTGLAALLMAYFPELDVADVRRVILESAVPLGDRAVRLPGEDETARGRFADLAATGGIVNAFRAVELARALVESRE